jgi:diamine N-acetyltransferase
MNLIRNCDVDDLIALQEISYRTYNDTFEHLNTSSNMKAYFEKAFNYNQLRDELLNRNSNFYFLFTEGELAGYLKINEYQVQTDIYDPKSLELERIYVKKAFQGNGLGRTLMDKAIEVAIDREKSYIWLGVWEKNVKAIQFYQDNGFYKIGKHSFFMGEEKQTDYIMKKDF